MTNINEAVLFFCVMLVVISVVFWWQLRYEQVLVKRMTETCLVEYNKSYWYHDADSFYCVRFPPRSTLDLPYVDMVEVRFT